MIFKPINRHVLVLPVEKEETDNLSSILVPDDYVKVKSMYEVYEVLAIAPDCERLWGISAGQQVIVNNSMIEEIKVHGDTYYLLLENYVYGVFTNTEEKQWQN